MDESEMMDRRKTFNALIVLSAVWALLLPVSAFFGLFAPMLAAGRMTLNTYFAIYGLVAMPVFLAVSLVTMWLFFWIKMHRTALGFALLPLIDGANILITYIVPAMQGRMI